MAKFLSGIAIALLLSSLALAQSAPPAQTSQPMNSPAQGQSPQSTQTAAPRIAPGSVIPVQLTSAVDAKKARSGEQVTAKVTQDLKASNGMMLLPKDTEIVGHITEAQPKNKQDKESQVGIVFDHAVTQNGDISYPLSIQAVISPEVFQQPNSGGNAAAPQAPSSSAPSQSPGGGGRGMGGGGQAAPSNEPPGGSAPEASNSQSGPPKITGQTQGVVGYSHMKLETATSAAQPSVISSEKNNVKLQNGTLMLLRVNQ